MQYFSSIFVQRRPKPTPSLHHSLAFLRFMGGGPRTFPGGLNKWQWKRLHEKKAKEKEKRLLDREKQIYQARIRSEIRAKLSASSQTPGSEPDSDQPGPNYGPLLPQEHIKALADRFMKEGAEDLWNEAVGQIKAPSPQVPRRRVIGELIDLQKLIAKKSGLADNNGVYESRNLDFWGTISSGTRKFSSRSVGLMGLGYNLKGYCRNGILMQSNSWLISRRIPSYVGGSNVMCGNGSGISLDLDNLLLLRCYSVDARYNKRSKRFNFARNESSSSEDDDDSDYGGFLVGSIGGGERESWSKFRLNRSGLNSLDDGIDDGDVEDGHDRERRHRVNVKRMMSSAALRNYDVKKVKKRIPLNSLEEVDDLSQHVEMIRKEVNKRRLEEHGEGKNEEETIYSSKRFDEYDISPLTIKALNAAGYVQMTRVQEATLSNCLQYKDALVKARTGTGKSAAFLLPAVETVLKASSSSAIQRIFPVYVVILYPTRELVSQIAAEATVLLKYHDGIGVQTLVGGTCFKLILPESEPSQVRRISQLVLKREHV